MSALRRLLMTMGLGAGLMYLFDPELGERRRAGFQDQVTKFQNDMEDFWRKGSRDFSNRTGGLTHEGKAMIGLAGDQGENEQAGPNIGGMLDRSWPPSMQLIGTVAGSVMIISGMVGGGFKGTIRSLLGALILTRSIANKSVAKIVGTDMSAERGGAIDVNRSINIDAPVNEVFEAWHNYTNFPRFMSYLKEVRDLGGGRTHWVARGPAGITAEWDARETQVIPNKVIAWQSEPGSMVANAGSVRFNRNDENSTRVDVRLSYTPPAGLIGNALVSLLGANPDRKLAEDLNRFKSFIEHDTFGGRARSGREQMMEGQSSGTHEPQG